MERARSDYSDKGTSLSVRELIAFGCLPVIKEHQNFIEGPPEFTISIAWQDGGGQVSERRGWRYKIHHTGTDGKEKWVSAYGIASKDEARRLAEDRATRIAKAQQPEDVYRFTPEV